MCVSVVEYCWLIWWDRSAKILRMCNRDVCDRCESRRAAAQPSAAAVGRSTILFNGFHRILAVPRGRTQWDWPKYKRLILIDFSITLYCIYTYARNYFELERKAMYNNNVICALLCPLYIMLLWYYKYIIWSGLTVCRVRRFAK